VKVWDHWYVQIVGDQTLRQGDIFRALLVYTLPQDLPVPAAPPAPGSRIPVDVAWARGDWIIMSASCDVDRPATVYPQVVLGRVVPATPVVLGTHSEKEYAERIEVIKKGLEPTRFMLAECPLTTPPFPPSVVQYRVHLTMPSDYLRRNCAGERLRLRHPIREVFGSWVGANIARVGPEDHVLIPANPNVRTWPVHVLRAADAE
jgi:hypothetical protein